MTKFAAVVLGLALIVSPRWKQESKVVDNLTPKTVTVNRDHPAVSRSMNIRRKVILWATERYDSRKQAEAFVEIVWRESRFDPTAVNESSGAYGLAQANPSSKYEVVGSDWKWNIYTQLRWMAKYIEERYGTPRNALAWHNAKGWY